MRYKICFDRMVNMLTPHFLGGRKLILYLQSLLSPLQDINDLFVEYAKEVRIEATMTSQIGRFEWFLNHKLRKYFLDRNDRITLTNGSHIGVPLYWESANIHVEENMKLINENEEGKGGVLYLSSDKPQYASVSFVVNSPEINTGKISKENYLSILNSYIEKYRIANKTYQINYNIQ